MSAWWFMKKSCRRLELIAEYGQTVQSFLHGKSLEDWRADMQLRYAVAHALAGVVENVKEYVRDGEKLPELSKRYPSVEWAMIIRFRDKMTHYYEILDQDSVYEIATKQLPVLLDVAMELLASDNTTSDR